MSQYKYNIINVLDKELREVQIEKSFEKNSRAGSGLRFHQGTRQYYRR